jgi:hypothetical protein
MVEEDIVFGYKNYGDASDIRTAEVQVAEYDTAKESLISLLKSNYCFIKNWLEYPMKEYYLPDYGVQKYPQELYTSDCLTYMNAPIDYLIIVKN